MKTLGLNRMLPLFFLMVGWIAVHGQSQSEVPGDHFSLEGALELFKKSASPEEFERLLNSADSKVNNLDLNGDGDIDYIKVIDRNEGNVHAFILQAIISETETQDVAVVELEKLANGKAVLQITGDEDVYGIETIIEPTQEVRINAGTSTARSVVNVWAWPSVQFIYGPYYSGWVSPWRWSYRPFWWHPWSPFAYYDYYSWWQPYRPYYSVCYSHRVAYAQRLYRPYRTTSVIVHDRHHTQVAHYRSTRNDYGGRNRYDDGRNRYDDGRPNGRQNNGTNRYDANGRLSSRSGQVMNSRSSTNTWNQRQGTEDLNRRSSTNRSTSDSRTAPNGSPQRSTGQQRNDLSNKWTGTASNNNTPRQRETPSVQNDRSGSFAGLNIQRSSGSSNLQRSSGNSNIERSSGSSNIQRSSGSSNLQRSSGSSNIQRSSGSTNIQRSPGSSNIQRSSGSSNIQRSSGSSNIQRSSGGSNIQRSSGSSSIQRSGGGSSRGSSVQRSSGSSNIQRSSGGSNIQRSSGSSSIQRSGGGTSRGSSIQRSSSSGGRKSSGGQTRGRH